MKKKPDIYFTFLLAILTISSSNDKFAFGREGHLNRSLLRSPVVGVMQNNQIPVLVRGTQTGLVRIEYHSIGDTTSLFTDWVRLSFSRDLSVSFCLTNLEYSQNYEYRVEFDDETYTQWFTFKTFPRHSQPGEFSFVFSACVRDKYTPHNVFETISELSPTFVALLGDQMYADFDGDINAGPPASVLAALRAKYNRNFDEYFQTMSSQFPVVAIWDDHDYGQDNSDHTYRYKAEARKVFKETYPIYPFRVEDGGLDYRFTIAGVDIFVLDTRW